MKQYLRDFLAAPSGSRFRRVYRRRKAKSNPIRSMLMIVIGVVLLPLGVAMLVLPGPGLIVLVFAAGLFAGESALVARMLDRLDVRLSTCYARWRRRAPQ